MIYHYAVIFICRTYLSTIYVVSKCYSDRKKILYQRDGSLVCRQLKGICVLHSLY